MNATIASRLVRGQMRWVVDTRTDGRRTRTFFSTRSAAEERARSLRTEARRGGDYWAGLAEEERETLIWLHRQSKQTGISLRDVWAMASARPTAVKTKPIREAIDEFLAAKATARRRTSYLARLKSTLTRFARGRAEQHVHTITPDDVEGFVPHTGSPWSRNTQLAGLNTWFAFCIARKYTGENPAQAIDAATIDHRSPHVLTPDQAAHLLRTIRDAWPRHVAGIALMMFAGIRPDECSRITWEAIREGTVIVDACASKIHRRRIVPLMPAAAAWLDLGRRLDSTLPMSTNAREWLFVRTRSAMGWERWPNDILRHTAASYLLAHHKDIGKVALDLGHSPGILMRHYRALVTDTDAARFWALRPDTTPTA